MVQRFFMCEQQMGTKSDPITLLSGPPSCGKTSLLFQFAFNCALSGNVRVVFICKRSRLESKPPYLSQGVDPCSDVFKRIEMKYVDDDEGIRNYFAAFHLYAEFPVAVVVDDFGDFFHERSCQERYANPRGRDLAMVRTLALCCNAITHASEKGSCKMLLSDTYHGSSPRLLFIYKRWISTIFVIEGDGSGSFLLRMNSSSGGGTLKNMKFAKYTIARECLHLEGIDKDSEK